MWQEETIKTRKHYQQNQISEVRVNFLQINSIEKDDKVLSYCINCVYKK